MFSSLRTCVLLALTALPLVTVAANEESADLARQGAVSRDGGEIEYFCTEMEDVRFSGSNNRIETNGPCNSITIQGSNNNVAVRSLASLITVNGNDNTVYWQRGDRPKPEAKVSGRNNIVEPEKLD